MQSQLPSEVAQLAQAQSLANKEMEAYQKLLPETSEPVEAKPYIQFTDSKEFACQIEHIQETLLKVNQSEDFINQQIKDINTKLEAERLARIESEQNAAQQRVVEQKRFNANFTAGIIAALAAVIAAVPTILPFLRSFVYWIRAF